MPVLLPHGMWPVYLNAPRPGYSSGLFLDTSSEHLTDEGSSFFPGSTHEQFSRSKRKQGASNHSGFLAHQDFSYDTWRDGWRRRHHVNEPWIPDRNVDLRYDLCRCGSCSNIRSSFSSLLYWFVIVATTTAGTTLADFVDRSVGIGYLGGSALLATLLAISLFSWHRNLGSVSVENITSHKAEAYYWATIMFSQTLGTALGDWMAGSTGLGYGGGAIVFALALAIVAALHLWTTISKTLLFWAAFILTRPLGATVGDFLDKPMNHGGLALSRYTATVVLAVLIVGLIALLPQRSGKHPT